MAARARRREVGWSIRWLSGFIFACLLFFPVTMRGDFFGCFVSVYTYFYLPLLFVWTRRLTNEPNSAAPALRITKLVLIFAVFYPLGSYFYNGRTRFVSNAAQHDHPLVLNVLLDTSNPEESSLAPEFAEAGENPQIVDALRAKGAKTR